MPPTRRRRTHQRRADLLWAAAGFALVQVALAIALEKRLPVRDPDFAIKLDRLQARVQESPNRPLAVVLGSSRTQMGLDAGWLNQGTGRPWLTFNLGFEGCGPMMSRISLRRLSAAGIRPDLVVIEVVPAQLLVGNGCPIEERGLKGTRFRADEVSVLYPYSSQPWRLVTDWFRGRALPAIQHRADLVTWLSLDRTPQGNPIESGKWYVDPSGWKPGPAVYSLERAVDATHRTLNEFRAYFRDGRIAARQLALLRDLLTDCRRRQIPAALLLMPESTAFRNLYPDGLDHDLGVLLDGLRQEFGLLALIDARGWIGDNDFFDANHLTQVGARAFTDRFGREALRPLLNQSTADSQVVGLQ